MTYQLPPNYPPPPGRPPYGYPYPPQPPQKKTNPALWIILGIVLAPILLCGGCLGLVSMSADSNDDTTTATFTTNAAPKPALAEANAPEAKDQPSTAGTAVRDGKFEFQVTAVDPPVKTIAPGDFREETALGEFIVVHVNVTNIGDRPQSYFDSNQKLYDDQGREYANNSSAAMGLDSDTWMSDLNPGFTIPVKIVFDVPVGTAPAVIEFHDSFFSGGAKVALR